MCGVECDECHGKRFNPETLAVQFKGRSIADVLEMSIGEANELFGNIPAIRGVLATLCAVGLDYLTLGQSAATLSGGEAQRVKLAAELSRPQTGRTLYILDEPTTGLHFDDIRKLLKVLQSLVELGNTVVVIEHNLDVMKTSDWIIDLGPDAGSEGGWIVAEGTPEDVVAQAQAFAGQNGNVDGNGARPRSRQNGRGKRAPAKQPSAAAGTPPHGRLRSYTGELLAPVLARGTRGEVEIFDAQEAARKQPGDLDLRKVGRDTRMPWQVDGRRWHTVDRVGHTGRPCRWEGEALARVVDRLEAEPALGPVNWNDRSVVEVTGPGAAGTWFLHALTGDEWLLTLRFRVKRSTFREDELQAALGLKSLDELDELPVYGRSDRVRVKNLKGPWQEVTITVHWLREIDTAAFRRFLDRAIASYVDRTQTAKLDLADLTPWKVLGRKWHLSRKGFPGGKRVAWEPLVLEQLFDLLQQTLPQSNVDWSNKQVVYFEQASGPALRAAVHTKRRGGVDLALSCPSGRFALGRIAQLGAQREIVPDGGGRELIKIRFDAAEQVRQPELRRLLAEAAEP
jgi:excinuclease ABC subunit A